MWGAAGLREPRRRAMVPFGAECHLRRLVSGNNVSPEERVRRPVRRQAPMAR